jgi:hypothetical protein
MAWTGNGGAEPVPGVEVHWVAPATCPGAEDLQARVHRLLGAEPPARPRRERLVVDGTVVRLNGRYRLSLNVRKGGELAGVTRVFDSESCESLAGAAAVTLALLARGNSRWDEAAPLPSSGSSSSSASPATPAPTAVPPTSGPSAVPAPPAAGAPAIEHPPAATTPPPAKGAHPVGENGPAEARGSVILEGPLLAVDEGVLPSWAFGLGVGAGVRLNRFEALLAAVLWLPQSDRASDASPYAGRYARLTGELSSCYDWPGGPFALGPCMLLTLEDVTANGTGPGVVGRAGHIAWMRVGIAARAEWSPSPWTALFIRPSLAINTSRPTFAIDAVGPLYQTPLAAVGIDLGCEWIL